MTIYSRALFSAALLAAALTGCTKRNPDFCCTDEASCQALGQSSTVPCSGDLVCRGNQCIAETCTTSADCDASLPFCDSAGMCAVTCEQDSQCPGLGGNAEDMFCSTSGTCEQCRTSSDCSGATPVCDTGACRGCEVDADCSSDVCGSDGACVDSADVVYLAMTGSDSGTCTQALPCASLNYGALQTSDARSAISIAPGMYTGSIYLTAADISTTQVDIHGNGATMAPKPGNDGSFFSTEVGMKIRDLTINGDLGDPGTVLAVDGPGAIELDDVTILGGIYALNSNAPVTANNVTIDGAVYAGASLTINGGVIKNADTGVTTTSSISLTNVMMYNFTTIAVDLSHGTGTLSFVTIADSGTGGGSGATAVTCNTGANSIEYSIVWTPGESDRPEIFGCNVVQSIVGPIAIAGATNVDPQFVNPAGSDYHIGSGSPAIDQINSGPAYDFEGDTRPQLVRWDIGADEYKP